VKKILFLAVGMGLVLSLGMAYAEEGRGGITYPSEKMIRDYDLPRLNLDKDRATVNQMPTEPGFEGSAAGGLREEPGSMGTGIEQSKKPVDKSPAVPEEEGTGAGGASKVPERYSY
jgi:hypothetical protein